MKKRIRKRSAPFGGPTNEPSGNPSPPPGPPGESPGESPAGAGRDPLGEDVAPPEDIPSEDPSLPEDPMMEAPEDPMMDEDPLAPRLPEEPMDMDIPMDVDVSVQDKSVNINMGDTSIRIGEKNATTQEWVDVMSGTTLSPEDPSELSKDTHEYIMNNPRNRREPSETFDVKVTAGGKFEDGESLLFALQETLHSEMELNGDTITVKSVENPLALIEELSGFGLDASLSSGNLEDIYEGMKVAFLGDIPEIGFYNDPAIRTEALVTSVDDHGYYLQNNKLGNFVASREEIAIFESGLNV